MRNGKSAGSENRIRRLTGLVAGIALAVAMIPSSGAQSAASEQSEADAAAAAAAIAAQVRTEIGRLPTTSTSEEYEASILFVVGQSEQSPTVICAAFDELKLDAAVPGNAKNAMDNVCRTIRTQRGTGAVGSTGAGAGSGTSFTPSSFSSPVVTLGGGSNYIVGN